MAVMITFYDGKDGTCESKERKKKHLFVFFLIPVPTEEYILLHFFFLFVSSFTARIEFDPTALVDRSVKLIFLKDFMMFLA